MHSSVHMHTHMHAQKVYIYWCTHCTRILWEKFHTLIFQHVLCFKLQMDTSHKLKSIFMATMCSNVPPPQKIFFLSLFPLATTKFGVNKNLQDSIGSFYNRFSLIILMPASRKRPVT